jgi:hypothetical protein
MKKLKFLIALAFAACSTSVVADEGINYSFGLKSWNHKLKTTGGSATENTSATIVSATARKGDYFLATSFFLPTTYSLSGQYILRRDTDYALGYSLNSNFSALLGSKRVGVRQYNSGWTNSAINMTYLGLNGFTPIGENTFIYGQVTRSIKLTDSSITDGTKETFTGYEAGYGYVLNKSTQLTVGYRNQKFSTNNSNYVSNTLPGIIFGINITP